MRRKLASPHAQRVISAVLAVAASCAGATARAEAPQPAQPQQPAQLPIVLVLDPCAVVDAREVRRLLPIEMGAPLAPGSAGEGDTTRVFVGCVPGSPQLVRLEVRDIVSGRHVDRVITLVGDSKTDQARLVAIVAVELVATSRSELRERVVAAAPPAAEPASLVVTAKAEPVEPPRAREPAWRALAFGSVRHVEGLPSMLPGGGLALERSVARHFVLGADVVAEGAGQPTALGDVAAFVASASAFAGVRVDRGPWALQAGGGARGGVARFSGEARRASAVTVASSVFSAPWAGALFEARATATLAHGVVILLGGELGYVTSPVEGYVSGHDAVAMRGLWWSAALGVGHAL
jgi:hypothetical protein